MRYLFLLSFVFSAFISKGINLDITGTDSITPTHNPGYILNIKKMKSKIILDGVIDEPDWLNAERADRFHRVLPVDTGLAGQQSQTLITYNDKAFYIAFIFHDTIPGKRIMESFRRDFTFPGNDNFLVFIDPFSDQTNGYSFGISASGAKWDGVMSQGQASNLDWDCKWESKTKHYPDKWISEMCIPFKSIKYPSSRQQWNVNFSRQDLKSNEKSSWAPVPRQFPTASLAYTGVMKFDSPLPKSRMQFSLIPYLYWGYSKDSQAGTAARYKKDFGFDAKVGLSTSMNLDLTYNPDFAQVEVDQQVTNIDRFELYYPEKRRFFLENNDLFGNYGASSATPFFSRRIGLNAPVIAGARLSGKIGNNWRIGFMNMTTQKSDNQFAHNFTVASVQKKIFARSNIGLIFVNKEYLEMPKDTSLFNRVAGMDINLASKNNVWTGKLYFHRSFRPENPDNQYAQGALLSYKNTHLQAQVVQRAIGENYLAETGYVTRTGYKMISPEITYLFVPNKRVVSHGPQFETDMYFNPDFQKIDHEHTLMYSLNFRDQSQFNAGYKDFFIELQKNFDPTHVSNTFLKAGTSYHFGGVFINYNSTRKTLLNWSGEAVKSSFYNGDIWFIQGKIGYRFQPYVNFSVNLNYTDLLLPEPFKHTKFWLISPKCDITFTDKLFWSTFVQYNEQAKNMNINTRLQWRYQPVSDFFVVYTDNYFPGEWQSKNKALVLKMTYWFN